MNHYHSPHSLKCLIDLNQAESGSKQRLQMEYEGAIKSHKYNVDAITKSIQDIQQRNNRLMDIQKTVINSRRMYDRNIKVHFVMKPNCKGLADSDKLEAKPNVHHSMKQSF